MPEQFGEKQHEATAHRRQQARQQGQVARSQDLTSALLLIGAVIVLMRAGGGVVKFMGGFARRQLGEGPALAPSRNDIVGQSVETISLIGEAMLPVFGILFLIAVIANVGQVGFLFLPQKLAFDFSRLSPLKGMKRLFSLSNVMRLAFGVLKIVVVAAVAGWALRNERETMIGLSNFAVVEVAQYLVDVTLWTCLKVGAALLILAILDYAYQRWKHEQDLRMTTQEMREELKTLQGDPQIVARRRAVQRQLVLNRIGTAVPEADVVVTNPTELAIAIRYDHESMDAPLVLAKGAGLVAQRIRRIALEHNIPIVEKKELAQALYKKVEIGKPIPREEYAAMAEVLRYVYELKGRTVPGMLDAA